MENQKLLRKYQIKLSVFFALFVMFFLYFIQIIFLGIQFISANLDLKETLITKMEAVENVLKNKQIYFAQIQSSDETLQKIILKTLENTIIFEGKNKILDFSNGVEDINIPLGVTNANQKKYYAHEVSFNHQNYTIIVFMENPFQQEGFLNQIGMYFLVLSPFFILFYLIGYKFVGRNFRVIEESIHSLEDFTAQVNHEMKTPLSEMISTLSLAQKIHNYEDTIAITLASALKLNKILDSLTGMVHLSDISYRKERVDITKIIDDIVQELKTEIGEKNIQIQTHIQKQGNIFKANREHLYLCIKNILSNAIKYSHINGTIEVVYKHGILEIKDYGIGIDKANLKKIFHRYFRESYTTQEGLGLGLALVKKITDINHWKLEVESQKDEYTKIIINFK